MTLFDAASITERARICLQNTSERRTIMNTLGTFRVCTNLIGVALFLGSIATLPLRAEFECRLDLMAGAWVHHAELFIQEREGIDPFPPPGTFSEVGIVVFDERGKATVGRQTNSTTTGVSRFDAIPINDIQITINPDCTGTLVFRLRDLPPEHPLIAMFGYQPGQVVFDNDLVCADGQMECWATFTQPTAIFTGISTLKRVEAFNAELDVKLDSLSARIDAIMRWLSIPSSPSQ